MTPVLRGALIYTGVTVACLHATINNAVLASIWWSSVAARVMNKRQAAALGIEWIDPED